jgi:hypothetical protein
MNTMLRSLGAGSIALILAGVLLVSVQATAETSRIIKFEAYRNGSEFGFSTVKIDGQPGDETVEVVTALRVGLGPITAFKYLLRTRTQWRGGQIERLLSVVNDDGDIFEVNARRSDAGLLVEGFEGKFTAPAQTLPTTYWRSDMVNRQALLSTQHGKMLKVGFQNLGEESVTSEGKQITAAHYAMRGDLDIDIWYDGGGDWVKLNFTVGDSEIEYKRVTPTAADLLTFIPMDKVSDISGSEVHAMIDP